MKELLKSILSNEIVWKGLFLFSITVFTQALSTLRTMFISRKIFKPVYVILFVDAIIFATIMKGITNNDNIAFVLIYALGKSVGAYFGNKVDDRLGIGINEIQLILSNREKRNDVADRLRDAGYTVNNFTVNGYEGEERFIVEAIVNRKEFDNYQSILNEANITNPTLKIKSLNKVSGKITVSSEK